MMNQTVVRNSVVLASAGSGKTFRLSDRIVKLLALGALPDQIVALTFTRAAAGEFIARTLAKLADAAALESSENPAVETAERLRKRLGLPPSCDRAFFLQLLRATLTSMHRMTLGTLDSFFARVVNNNPTELGLDGGEVRTLSDVDAERTRRRVIRQLLAETADKDLSGLWGDLRAIGGDKDVAEPIKALEDNAKTMHDTVTLVDGAHVWGDLETIWPTRPVWFAEPSPLALEAAAHRLVAWLKAWQCRNTTDETRQKKLLLHVPALLVAAPGAPPDEVDVAFITGPLRPLLDVPPGAGTELKHGNVKALFPYPAEVCSDYQLLARRAVGIVFKTKLTRTQSMHRLLVRYEKLYDATARRAGELTFSDYVTLLLQLDDTTKLDLGYRLDCNFRHWLLDEFQDTSARQWQVLETNVGDILDSDNSDGRSAFIVGDLKQSLYGWREGNPRLLADTRKRVQKVLGPAADERMDTTRRCAEPVVTMVNTLLGKLQPVGAFFSQGAADRWAETFVAHASEAHDKKLGEALWVRLEKSIAGAGEEEEEELNIAERHARWIGAHLKASGLLDGRQLRAGASCAVLVPTNKQAAQIAEILRKIGIEAADEANGSVTQDNPLTAGLVALIQATAHPGDKGARAVAEMAPAAKAYLQKHSDWESVRLRIASRFAERGAEALVLDLIAGIQTGTDNAGRFLAKRLQRLLELAVAYDEGSERDLADFATYAIRASARDAADPRSVQVLTIHRSKGLEYTTVYLPCLNNRQRQLARARTELPLVKDNAETFLPAWILSRPKKELSELDPTLANALELEQADAAYESLCRLYVGMTRAARQLVMVSDALTDTRMTGLREPAAHGSYDAADLLEAVLGGDGVTSLALPDAPFGKIMWHRGDVTWQSVLQPKERAGTIAPALVPLTLPALTVPRLQRLRPSAPAHGKALPWHAPSDTGFSGKAFGSLVHDLFQHLEWDAPAFLPILDARIQAAAGTSDHAALVQGAQHIRACLDAPDVAALLLRKPTEDCLLWRERAAVLVHEGKLMSAIFDRVHVVPGKSAVVIDYKTNDCSAAELREIYQPQMDLYRAAVAKLAGIPEAAVRCVLLSVRLRACVGC